MTPGEATSQVRYGLTFRLGCELVEGEAPATVHHFVGKPRSETWKVLASDTPVDLTSVITMAVISGLCRST